MTFHTPFDNHWQDSSTHQRKNGQPKTLFDTAEKLTQSGISVLPVGRDKLPYSRLLPTEMNENGEPVHDKKTGNPKHTWKPPRSRQGSFTTSVRCNWQGGGWNWPRNSRSGLP